MGTTPPASLDVSYEDDPRVLAEAAVDDYADHVVSLWRGCGEGPDDRIQQRRLGELLRRVRCAVAANYGTSRRSSA